MNGPSGIDRRTFLRLLGGGVAVLVCKGPVALLAQDRRRIYPEDLNAYLLVGADGRVTVFAGKIEMGQGVMTSLAQMAAEELGVALESIDMVLGDTDRCPWDMGTFGSLTTRMFGPALRAAAAEARLSLVRLAASRLGVKPEQLVVAGGVVSVAADPRRKVGYGELAQGKQIARVVGEEAVLRAAREMSVMGASPRRLDGPEKVTGAARYAGDLRRPGMLYARLLRPPAHGATLASVDTAAAAALAGVTVVHDGDLVAVLHAEPEAAERALAAVRADWKPSAATVDPDTIFAHLQSAADEGRELARQGDIEAAAAASAAQLLRTTYRKGYVAHAPMEPHTALAEVVDGKLTVWASTQTPFPTRDDIAATLGLTKQQVRVITPYVGGGFGGKSAHQQALEAARLAKATGKPVQVAWTRAEEFFFDTFDPAAVVDIAAALDAAGKIVLWDYSVWAAGNRGADVFYDVPNVRVRAFGGSMFADERRAASSLHPFAVGPWRAPGANMNVFARESHLDALAAAARLDPLELRLRNLTDPRMRRVLTAAADAFGWKGGALPAGRGRGVACSVDAGSYVALMAEVAVDRAAGTLHVERIVCAQDMGLVVNPEGAKMQVEGAITMGLGYTLGEELRFRGGEILDKNFGTYSLPRFSWVPHIEAVLVKNDELAPQGGGEPAIVPTGAAIANAVFSATGARVERLPITPARLREALQGAGSTASPAA